MKLLTLSHMKNRCRYQTNLAHILQTVNEIACDYVRTLPRGWHYVPQVAMQDTLQVSKPGS